MALGGALKSVFTRFTFGIDGGKLSAINRTTGQAVKNLSMAAQQSAVLKRRVGGFIGGIKAFIALAAGSAIIRGVTTNYSLAADQVAKFAKATGVATDSYQGLIHAAGLSGITQEEVNKSLLQLSKRARDASIGIKKTKDAFEEAKVAYKDTNGELLNGDQILLNLADRWQKMPDGAKKTALAMELMGRSGARLNVLLNEGSEGIKRYIAKAKKLGIVLSKKALADAEQFNDEMLRMKSVLIGLRNQIASKLIPALTTVIQKFVMWTQRGNNARAMLKALGIVSAFTALMLSAVVTGKLINSWATFVSSLKLAVMWMRGLSIASAAVAIKVALIIGVIAGIALLIEDLVFFAQGEESLVGDLFGRDPDLLNALNEIKLTFTEIASSLKVSFAGLWESVVALAAAFGIELTTVKKLLKVVGKFLFRWVLRGLIFVVKVMSVFVSWIAAAIRGVAWLASVIIDVLGGAVRAVASVFDDFWGSAQSVFDGIENAALSVAVNIKRFFVAAADKVLAAWNKVTKFFKGAVSKTKAALKFVTEFVGGGDEPIIKGLPGRSPGGRAPGAVGGRAPVVVNSNVTVNADGLTEAEATRVATAAAKAAQQEAVNGLARDLSKTTLTGAPVAPVGGIL